MKNEIPIMFCFDNNYVIPAAAAFYSLLENANKNYFYKLFILHSDITERHQNDLIKTVEEFKNISEIVFINMEHQYEELWEKTGTKGHFSKELIYKLLAPSIFPQYDKLVISDVDVIFLGDISESYTKSNVEEDVYLWGIRPVGKIMEYMDVYKEKFTSDEIKKLGTFAAGYIVYNLKLMRKDNLEEKLIECFTKESHRINQPEQDVLNLCCYPKTGKLPLKYLACSYMWDLYQDDQDFDEDFSYSADELKEAMEQTIQLHYATSTKPWNVVDCTKSEEWFKYIVKTELIVEYLTKLAVNSKKKETPVIVGKNHGRIYRLLRYIKHNPTFFVKKSFYKKVFDKFHFWFSNNGKILYIFDDTFPSKSSPFRYEEYLAYFKKFKNVECLTSGLSLGALKEKKIKQVIEKFSIEYPQFSNRFYTIPFTKELELNRFQKKKNKYKKHLAVICFVSNMQQKNIDNIEFLNTNKIPFVFTLYPGGLFIMNDEECDQKLEIIFKSPMFRKVIVTQKITEKYLLEKKFCKEDDIVFIPGIVTPSQLLNIDVSTKKHYGIDKDKLDICFVAHKYTPTGIDKGYDKFIEFSKKISKETKNVFFHVVGSFDETIIDVEEIKDRITFYGIKPTEWFKDFYIDKDIILSPNIPNTMSKGGFDGFPTGACTEAMLNEVALFATDELNQNIFFKDDKSFVLIKPDANDIYKKINYYYKNPKKLVNVAREGYKIVNIHYSTENQVGQRINLIEGLFNDEEKI